MNINLVRPKSPQDIGKLIRSRKLNLKNETFTKWMVIICSLLSVLAIFRTIDMVYNNKMYDELHNTTISNFKLNFGIVYTPLATWLLQNHYIKNENFKLPHIEGEDDFSIYLRTLDAFLDKTLLFNYGNLMLSSKIAELEPYSDLADNCQRIAEEKINCENSDEIKQILYFNYKRPFINMSNVIKIVRDIINSESFSRLGFMNEDFPHRIKESSDSLIGYDKKFYTCSKSF